MNKLVVLYSALRHTAGGAGAGITVATTLLSSERPAHGHDHGLFCAWRIDPATGRLGCVWSSP